MSKLFFKGLIEKAEDGGLISVAVASDASVDRDGEIVDPNGIDTKNFEKNPVLLWAHDYREEPMGKVIQLVKDGSRLLFSAQFAIDQNPRAKQVYEMMKAGFLNAFSIGFIPKEWKDEDRDGSRVRTFTRSELLEISVVPVPANPNALVMARAYESVKFDENLLSEIETKAAEETEREEKEKAERERNEKLEKAAADIVVLTGRIDDMEKQIADNGEKTDAKAVGVEELLRHPEFQRGVLTTIDKAMGNTLRGMKGVAK